MKFRKDFISNSSSTSFIFINEDENDAAAFSDDWQLMLGSWFQRKIDLMEPCTESNGQQILGTTCKVVSDEKFIEDWWKPSSSYDYYRMFDGSPLTIVPEYLVDFLSFFDADVFSEANASGNSGDLVITPQFVANKEKIKDFLTSMLAEKYSKWIIGYSNVDNEDWEALSDPHWPQNAIWKISYDS